MALTSAHLCFHKKQSKPKLKTMKKQIISTWLAFICATLIFSTSASAQCPGDKVKIYKCANKCGTVDTKCVKPNQVGKYLSMGWQQSPCIPCPLLIRVESSVPVYSCQLTSLSSGNHDINEGKDFFLVKSEFFELNAGGERNASGSYLMQHESTGSQQSKKLVATK